MTSHRWYQVTVSRTIAATSPEAAVAELRDYYDTWELLADAEVKDVTSEDLDLDFLEDLDAEIEDINNDLKEVT